MTARIFNDQWYENRENDVEKESKCIMAAAAKLFKASIREMKNNIEKYPVNSEVSDCSVAKEWVPPLLPLPLQDIIPDELKQNCIRSKYCSGKLSSISDSTCPLWCRGIPRSCSGIEVVACNSVAIRIFYITRRSKSLQAICCTNP